MILLSSVGIGLFASFHYNKKFYLLFVKGRHLLRNKSHLLQSGNCGSLALKALFKGLLDSLELPVYTHSLVLL